MPNFGFKHSEKTKKLMSLKGQGRKFSEKHKNKISKALIGKKKSEEAKKKNSESHKGNKHPQWKGGRNKASEGYVRVFMPNHPFCNKQKYVLEHRLVMEAHIGRPLLPTEVVHHINCVREDNRIENLVLFDSSSEHLQYHQKERKQK